jgi:hypothetical protein
VLGAEYYRAGNCAEALRWLGKSLEAKWDVAQPLNEFVPAVVHRQMGQAERAAGLLRESIRLVEEIESRKVDGAVPSVIAADWMTIQIYRREAETLFRDSSESMMKNMR